MLGILTAFVRAADAPHVSEFVDGLSNVRTQGMDVQGSFRMYRADEVLPAALTGSLEELRIPLVRHGELWRQQNRFRATYLQVGAVESRQSVALDESQAFEFSSGIEPDQGVLRVMDAQSPEGANSIRSIRSQFVEPLDALWSLNGVALADLLQRPDVAFQPSQTLPGGVGLVLSSETHGKTHYRLEFLPEPGRPFGSGTFEHEDAGLKIHAERRVQSEFRHGLLVPTRIVDVVTTGESGTGYTSIVELDLQPLRPGSPVSRPIEPASFEDLGSGFQVYRYGPNTGEALGARHQGPETAKRESAARAGELRQGSRWRSWFLWINGGVLVLIAAAGLIRRMRARS